MTNAKNLYQNRRSQYALGKKLPIEENEVLEIIDNAVKYSPSAFNSQTAHAVVLLGDNHQKLWDITFEELGKFLPNEDAKAATKAKLDGFAAAYGTILFFEDHDVVCRELMLIKVKATATTRSQIVQIADVYRGNVLDISPTSMIIEVIGLSLIHI